MRGSEQDSTDWQALLEQLSIPRLPGSDGTRRVKDLVENLLRARGYRVERQGFDAGPRRLAASAVLGASAGWCALAAFPVLVLPSVWAPAALVVVPAGLSLAVLLAVGVAEGRIPIRDTPVPEENLIALREGGEPRWWFVCHSDSKAQGISLGARVVAVAIIALGVVQLVSLALLRLAGPVFWAWPAEAVLLTAVGGGLLSRGHLRDGSPGAVDNATGIIGALAALAALRRRDDVGFLMTGAEEFGMEGARKWARSPRGEFFVNFDGVDSRGRFNLMRHRPRGAPHGPSPVPIAVLRGELERAGRRVSVRRLPVGIMVDGGVLARAGLEGVTVSRGDWRTLSVIHTARDTADRVDPADAVIAGRAAAVAVEAASGGIGSVDEPL